MENEHDNLRAALDWSFASSELEPGLRIVGALWAFGMNRGYAREGQNQAERFLPRPEAGAPTYSRALFDDLGDSSRGSRALLLLGKVALAQGDNTRAQELMETSHLRLRKVGQVREQIDALNALGRLAQQQSDYARAHRLHQAALSLSFELGRQVQRTHALEALACMAARQGQAMQAATLFGAANGCFAAKAHTDLRKTLCDPSLCVEYDHLLTVTQTHLRDADFATAWAAGYAMELAQAVAYALAARPLRQLTD